MLNERHTLAKLRTELEKREGRLCKRYRRFGHIAQKYRSRKEETKKAKPQNRFEVLKSQIMQCRVREVRRQEIVREEVRCFGCKEKEHKKWECPKMKERGSGITMRSVGEGEGAQWSEGIIPKGSSNVYGGVNDT